MRTSERLQMLTTEVVDANGNKIVSSSIDWSSYLKNPVLLYNPETEGHGGVVVGKVLNIRRVGNGFAGNLSFMERYGPADIAYEKYVQGVMIHTSIGGYALGEERDGVFVTERYIPVENSCVALPANIECRQLMETEISASDMRIVNRLKKGAPGGEVRYLTMSATLTNQNNENIMTDEEKKIKAERIEAERIEAERIEAERIEAERIEAERIEAERKIAEVAAKAAEEKEKIEAAAKALEDAKKAEAKKIEAAANEAERLKRLEAEAKGMPKGMTFHDETELNKSNKKIMAQSYKELKCSAEFQNRMSMLNSALATGALAADATPENAETLRMLACAMLGDEKFVTLASAFNFTNGVTKERRNGLKVLVECAAGGAAAATLAAADLGVIKYMSLFYEKLLPNNSFMRSIRFVPMSDREGAIYVESGINPATYVGAVTPVNAQRYTYDDIKRTIERKVFSIQPVTFQNADMAILAYDKQSWGWTIAMDSVMSDVCTYILQVAANTPGVTQVATSGEEISSKDLFPIEAPNSNVKIKSVASADIIRTTGVFLSQNYKMNNRRVETVFPSHLFTNLCVDPYMRTILTPQLSANKGDEFDYSGHKISSRNPVARFNTTSGKPELDPSMYADKNVANDGTATDITPAVTTAAHVGAGISFVENEIIAGVGTIDVIVMPDPTNYGYTYSGWMSTGATIARQNGKGVALITPTVVTAGA